MNTTGSTKHWRRSVDADRICWLTLDKADAGSIRNAAVEAGMVTLRFDGARKVMLGMTTPEEVMLMTAESTD